MELDLSDEDSPAEDQLTFPDDEAGQSYLEIANRLSILDNERSTPKFMSKSDILSALKEMAP